jgi:hypothetical protein
MLPSFFLAALGRLRRVFLDVVPDESERPWLTFQADYSRWKDGNQKVLKRWETTIASSHGIVPTRLGRLASVVQSPGASEAT